MRSNINELEIDGVNKTAKYQKNSVGIHLLTQEVMPIAAVSTFKIKIFHIITADILYFHCIH